MVSHWLACPLNGYPGSDYGCDLESLVHTPLASGAGDALVAKMRTDIPLIGQLPPEMIAVYAARDPKLDLRPAEESPRPDDEHHGHHDEHEDDGGLGQHQDTVGVEQRRIRSRRGLQPRG